MKIYNIKDMKKEVECYHCGSPNLYNFLLTKNLYPVNAYITTSKHPKNNFTSEYKTIWVFVLSEELSLALKEWSLNKPSQIKREKGEQV